MKTLRDILYRCETIGQLKTLLLQCKEFSDELYIQNNISKIAIEEDLEQIETIIKELEDYENKELEKEKILFEKIQNAEIINIGDSFTFAIGKHRNSFNIRNCFNRSLQSIRKGE